MSKNKATKIIATIGPASDNENILFSDVLQRVNNTHCTFCSANRTLNSIVDQ